MLQQDFEYNEILQDIIQHGHDRIDRTGVGTRSLFGPQVMYADIANNFPILTTKKIPFKSVVSELLWFLSGSVNDLDLRAKNGTKRTIWTDNLEADYWKGKERFPGDLGMIYGKQWRNWDGVDQIAMIEDQLKNDPFSRRILLQSYSPTQIGNAALPACHLTAQFYVHGHDNSLSCHVYIRSNDMFLGHPFNIASYATLVYMLSSVHNFVPGDLIISMGDAHIYTNHYDQVNLQLSRRGQDHAPKLSLSTGLKSILDYTMDDFELIDYNPDPAIKAPMAV